MVSRSTGLLAILQQFSKQYRPPSLSSVPQAVILKAASRRDQLKTAFSVREIIHYMNLRRPFDALRRNSKPRKQL